MDKLMIILSLVLAGVVYGDDDINGTAGQSADDLNMNVRRSSQRMTPEGLTRHQCQQLIDNVRLSDSVPYKAGVDTRGNYVPSSEVPSPRSYRFGQANTVASSFMLVAHHEHSGGHQGGGHHNHKGYDNHGDHHRHHRHHHDNPNYNGYGYSGDVYLNGPDSLGGNDGNGGNSGNDQLIRSCYDTFNDLP